MKKIYLMALFAFALMGCESKQLEIDATPKGMLRSIFIRAENSVYHGVVDNQSKQVYFNDVEYGGYISNVSYKLDEHVTISPEPSTLIGKWPERAEFILTQNGKSETYEFFLTDYVANLPSDIKPDTDEDEEDGKGPGVIFFDNFDVDGTPNVKRWNYIEKGVESWTKYMSTDAVYAKDGALVVEARKGDDGVYRTGGLSTEGLSAYHNVRVDMKVRIVNTAEGATPCVWMMPDEETVLYPGFPECGRIDLLRQERNRAQLHHQIYAKKYVVSAGDGLEYEDETDFTFNEYCIVSVEKNDNAIIISVNGGERLYYPNLRLSNEGSAKQWPFAANFYLNLGYTLENPSADISAKMEIDWVKITDLTQVAN